MRIYFHNVLKNWITRGNNSNNTSEGTNINEKNFSRNFYAPAVYHMLWMYEGLKNKIIGDNFVILHRLMRIWRFTFIFILF